MEVFREYNAAATILFPLIERDINDFRTSGISFAASDTQISKNEGAFVNTDNVPVHEGNGIYSLLLSATEMTAARIAITVVDSAAKLWEDQAILIQTFGDASGGLKTQWQFDNVPCDLKQILATTPAVTNLKETLTQMVQATVDDAGFSPTTTQFEAEAADFSEATADHYKNRLILFTGTGGSTVLDGQVAEVTAYALVAGRARFTVSTLTEAPADGQAFLLI